MDVIRKEDSRDVVDGGSLDSIISINNSAVAHNSNKPRHSLEVVKFLDKEQNKDPDSDLIYKGNELKVLYGWPQVPKLPDQCKSLGGQCAFQAHTNLVWSIPSIGQSTPFGDVTVIRQKMISAVKVIKGHLRTGIIPTDQVESMHYYPGDERLVEFSVHCMLWFGGTLTPYRYKMMTFKSGACLGLGWLLKQPSGYFLVYGNRHEATHKDFNTSFHYVAVNVNKKLVIDNKSTGAFLRFCREAFSERLKTVHTILRFELLEGGLWKINF